MAVFTNVDALKEEIATTDPDSFFDERIRLKGTNHFGEERLNFAAAILSEEYGVEISPDELIVVGSAKVGFALHDKVRDKETIAPAFRPYRAESDIDLSICSQKLFELLWHEISEFACSQKYMPYRNGNLGNYLTYGWLRQDHFPKGTGRRLVRCDNLLSCRGRIRRDRTLGHPKVDLGIFYSIEHLKIYQSRSIRLCKQKLENPL